MTFVWVNMWDHVPGRVIDNIASKELCITIAKDFIEAAQLDYFGTYDCREHLPWNDIKAWEKLGGRSLERYCPGGCPQIILDAPAAQTVEPTSPLADALQKLAKKLRDKER
jgi:hypothetical protein